MQSRLEQENMNEQMLLELTQAANNLDEAQLESTIAERSLQQAEENMRVSRSQYDVGLETLSDQPYSSYSRSTTSCMVKPARTICALISLRTLIFRSPP